MLKKTERIIQKLITPKSLAALLTILFVVTLIPLLMIASYNVPSADDFSIGVTCRDAWLSTHSLWQVIVEAVKMAWNDYFHWMGYFSSIFMMSIHPGVFGESCYAATTWIMIGSVSFGTMYLFHAVFVKLLRMNKYICHCISMLTLLLTIQCAVGACEMYYWYCGAVNYTFFHGMSLLFLGASISAVVDEGKGKKRFDTIIACILGFFVGGGNYMTSLNIFIISAVVLFLLALTKKLKKNRMVLIPAGFFTFGFLLSCLAPGNSVRAAGALGMNPIKAIFVSLYYGLDYCLTEWTSWVTLMIIAICVPLFWKGLSKTKFKFPYPILVALFSYGVVSAMVTPPLFSLSNIVAGRLRGLMYVMYILVLILNVGYITGWVKNRISEKLITSEQKISEQMDSEQVNLADKTFSKEDAVAIVIAFGFLFFGSALCIIPESRYYTFTSAITDLASGDAKAYGQAMKERFEILNDDTVQDAVLKELPTKPELIYYSDIMEDPEYWENRSMAKGYHKKSVTMVKNQ